MTRIGIFYDFDLTLSEEFQQYPIFRHFWKNLQDTHGIKTMEEYWTLSGDCDFDVNYLQQMISDAPHVFEGLTNEKMEKEFGPQIKLSPGIPGWFPRTNKYAEGCAVDIEHHAISSGLAPLIKGTAAYPHFTSVHAAEFVEDENSICKIKRNVGSFNKVEIIKKLCKGKGLRTDLDINNYQVNYFNSIILGDGQSDKDMFRYIKQRGGVCICVFEPGDRAGYEKAKEKLGEDVHFIAPRDYSEESILERVVQEAIYDNANRDCDMDYDLIHRLELNQIRNPEIKKVALEHYNGCGLCQKRREHKAYFC